MRLTSKLLNILHLDPRQLLLSARSAKVVHTLFSMLDVQEKEHLDDLAFVAFMVGTTTMTEAEAYKVFDIFDVDSNGSIEFDEFYLIICILIAIKDGQQKQFLWNHSRTCFELIDVDGSNSVSREEFQTFAVMFNIGKRASREIFKDFDKEKSEDLDYEEFRMFTMACLDKQHELDMRYLKRYSQAHADMIKSAGISAAGPNSPKAVESEFSVTSNFSVRSYGS